MASPRLCPQLMKPGSMAFFLIVADTVLRRNVGIGRKVENQQWQRGFFVCCRQHSVHLFPSRLLVGAGNDPVLYEVWIIVMFEWDWMVKWMEKDTILMVISGSSTGCHTQNRKSSAYCSSRRRKNLADVCGALMPLQKRDTPPPPGARTTINNNVNASSCQWTRWN